MFQVHQFRNVLLNVKVKMSLGAGLQFVREDDFVEYFLFPQLNDVNEDAEKVNNELQNILKQINQLIEGHTQDYIWHKDDFNLAVRTESHQLLIEENNEKSVPLPPHLYGISYYGDNILDEWFVVFLIFEITKKFPGIVGRVIDSDGEFLLIEAADVLPTWASPDTCEQRVYIYEGHLQLIQNSPSNTSTLLSVSTAIQNIHQNPTLYRVSNEIQLCIDERLRDFPDKRENFDQYQIVRVPLGVAAILKEKPSLIAPVCRAFCERDPIDMKACRAMRFFPPENRVRTTVKFTRCLYAMITHNNYVPDRRVGWNLPVQGTEEYKEDLLGVKIACGFEILASQAKEDDDVENDRGWNTYLNNLSTKGYFKGNLEGSRDYCRLLDEAKVYYKENIQKFRRAPVVGKQILHLLRTLDINSEQLKNEENNMRPSDDDTWLNISPEELDVMLTRKYGIKKLFKLNGDVNAAEFTENVSEFLEQKSEFDGIDTTSSPSTTAKKGVKKNYSMRKAVQDHPIKESSKKPQSNEINFDPDSFQTHVKNFLDFVIPEDDWESNSEMSDYEDEDDLEKNFEDMEKTKMNLKTDIQMYMDQMDRELAATTIGKTFDTSKRSELDDFDDIESFKPIDIDVNTLRNMMDSYKTQYGGPGPVSNLLGAMGLGMSSEPSTEESEKSTSDIGGTQV